MTEQNITDDCEALVAKLMERGQDVSSVSIVVVTRPNRNDTEMLAFNGGNPFEIATAMRILARRVEGEEMPAAIEEEDTE
jgi:hypothetical protein